MITVHITDDHKILVEGLRDILNNTKNIRVIGESYTLNECRKALLHQTPDVLLLDLNLPDGHGVDFCAEVRKNHPEVKVLILTTHNEYSTAREVMDNGALGYLVKNALSEEIIAGIETVAEGETFLCDEIDILLRKRVDEHIWFTTREKGLLRLIADGYTSQEMAEKLHLSVETIKTYRKNLNLKTGAKNTIVLINTAKKNLWI